jgi:hypothetical protein
MYSSTCCWPIWLALVIILTTGAQLAIKNKQKKKEIEQTPDGLPHLPECEINTGFR